LPSVSQLCRDIGLNRQQVNKYLSGTSRPSPHNLRRVAAYLGIEPEELVLPAERFVQLWRHRGLPRAQKPERPHLPHPLGEAFVRPQGEVERFLGLYHGYLNSCSWPGHVLRYVTRVTRAEHWIATKSLARYADEPAGGRPYLMKCAGIATLQADLLVIVEQQLLGVRTLATTILQPTYRSDIRMLTGVCVDAPAGGARRPAASRVVFRYLGRDADARAAIAQTAILASDSPAIEPRIRALLAEPADPLALHRTAPVERHYSPSPPAGGRGLG
jgi:transcriptional regulator with XRE-family HTH domain